MAFGRHKQDGTRARSWTVVSEPPAAMVKEPPHPRIDNACARLISVP